MFLSNEWKPSEQRIICNERMQSDYLFFRGPAIFSEDFM